MPDGSTSSDLDAAAISRSAGRDLAWDVRVHARADSTMDLAADAVRAGVAEGTVFVADYQASGRGRRGRSWEAPPGTSLMLSIVLRPGTLGRRQAQIGMAMGLGLVQAVADAGVSAALKWPNDLLARDGDKLAGILAEARSEAVIVGLGLNVRQAVDALPAGATSLVLHGAANVDRSQLAGAVLRDFAHRYRKLLAGHDLVAEWSSHLVTLGQEIVVSGVGPETTAVAGRAVRVTNTGALVVQIRDGTERVFHAGDVSVRRV